MTPAQADVLARQFAASFPGPWATPAALDLWAADIVYMEEGRLGTAIARLRRNWRAPDRGQTHPSLHEVSAAYRALDTSRPASMSSCDDCGGHGWAQGPDTIPLGFTRPCSSVVPCACPAGRQHDEIFAHLAGR